MSDLKYWSSDANNNNASSPDGISPNEPIKNIDNWGREVMAATKRAYLDREWIDNNHIPTYVSSNSFTVETDLTAIYTINRRVRLIDSVGNKIYGTITASSYSDPNTTITLALDSTQLNANINQVAYGSFTGLSISKEVIAGLSPTNVPIGSIFSIASTNIPSGFLECNGARLLISAYENLADLLYVGDANNADESKIFGYKTDQAGIRTISGSYITIPDLRGEFIRGFDNGRGIDTLTDEQGNITNRAFGSFQEDEFKSHSHKVGQGRDTVPGGGVIINTRVITNGSVYGSTYSFGGSETRPRNIALTTIIKY